MARTRTNSAVFLSFTGLLVVATAASLAFSWPWLHEVARRQSVQLTSDAQSATPIEAEADFHLAVWLDRTNQPASLGLARAQLASGQAEAALATLRLAGQGSEVASLSLRTQLELGHNLAAVEAVPALLTQGAKDEAIILAALAYAQAGQTSSIPALNSLVSSPGALQHLSRISAGQLALAEELYVNGLPDSSNRLLKTLPTSFERNLLLAHIAVDRHATSELAAATSYLTEAISLNPADASTHQFLSQVYAERGLSAEATGQAALASKLLNGRP